LFKVAPQFKVAPVDGNKKNFTTFSENVLENGGKNSKNSYHIIAGEHSKRIKVWPSR